MRSARFAAAAALTLAAGASPAGEPGFVEDFTSGLGGWGGGATETLVPTGGVGGAGDPYLVVSNTSFSQVAIRSLAPQYTGDLIADGVTGVSFYLRNDDAGDLLHVHVAVGNGGNFWSSIAAFSPGPDGWEFCEVDFTDESAWFRHLGSGTFEEALRGADRLQFRHCPEAGDPVPPDGAIDFAIDRITVLPAGPEPCSPADLAEPFGQLDFSDVVEFLVRFGGMDAGADLAEPFGQWDFSDVIAFLSLFGAGCP